jgi:ArsR family transcriptional regulator
LITIGASEVETVDPTDDALQLDAETRDFAVQLFAALAHPTRLRMVELLTTRYYNVGEIAQHLGILQPNASQHLAVLSRAGIVSARADGLSRLYSLRGPRIAAILLLVNEFRRAHTRDTGRPPLE